MNKTEDRSGFTLIEVAISASLIVVILGTAISTLAAGRQASKSTMQRIDVEDKLRQVLQTFANEVRWSSRTAEDSNNNNTLDSGEDSNGNNRFEDDWKLTPTSLTFNARHSSGFALPITYRLVGDTLQKVVMTSPTTTTVTDMARGVTRFQVTEDRETVKVEVGITITATDGTTATSTQSVSVTPRN
jgi:type II secretory pathway component PulJ